MTRMQLDPLAVPYSKYRPYWSAFKVMLVVFVTWVAFDRAFSVLLAPNIDPHKNREPIPTGIVFAMTLRSLLRLCFGVYVWFCLWKTRGIVRQRYQIPPSCVEDSCGRLEDAACAFCVPCCTVAQLSRHTADFGTYHGACCSETGLPPRAPAVRVDTV